MCRKFRITTAAVLTLVLSTGCGSTPTAFVGIYGYDSGESELVSELLSKRGVQYQRVEASPPVGSSGSFIIHGSANTASRLANDLAYELYKETGVWVAVRPVEVTNHQYSAQTIGIYLISAEFSQKQDSSHAKKYSVVATRQYESIICNDWLVDLNLEHETEFRIAGSRVDDSGTLGSIQLSGDYRVSGDRLFLYFAGETHSYERELVVNPYSGINQREQYLPTKEYESSVSVFSCGYLQDLDVLIRH